jgi:nucleoside-diphosphate-sugar epimerase
MREGVKRRRCEGKKMRGREWENGRGCEEEKMRGYEDERVRMGEKEKSEKKVYILRPCMIHGPGNKGNLNLLFKMVSKGIPWPLGAFENKRSFTSIENLQFVIQQIIEKDIEPGTYQIADDAPLSTNQLIELIAASQGKKASIWRINSKLITFAASVGDKLHLPLNSERLKKLTESYVVSNSKLKKALGIENMPVSAEEGMRRTLKSFLRYKGTAT